MLLLDVIRVREIRVLTVAKFYIQINLIWGIMKTAYTEIMTFPHTVTIFYSRIFLLSSQRYAAVECQSDSQ